MKRENAERRRRLLLSKTFRAQLAARKLRRRFLETLVNRRNTDSSFFVKVTKDGFSEEEQQDREEGPDYATLLELDSETKNPLCESTRLGNSGIAVGQRPGLSQTISHAL